MSRTVTLAGIASALALLTAACGETPGQRAYQRREGQVVMRRQRPRVGRHNQPRRGNFNFDIANPGALRLAMIAASGRRQPHLAGQWVAERRPPIVEPGFEPVIAARLIQVQHMDVALDRPVHWSVDSVHDRGDLESSHFHDTSMASWGECESLPFAPNLWLTRPSKIFG